MYENINKPYGICHYIKAENLKHITSTNCTVCEIMLLLYQSVDKKPKAENLKDIFTIQFSRCWRNIITLL